MRYIFTALLFPLWIIPALLCAVFKDLDMVRDIEAEEETRREYIKHMQELFGDEWVKHKENFE